MAKNAFFRLNVKNGGTYLTLYPAIEGGNSNILASDVILYLDKMLKFPYDKAQVSEMLSKPILGLKEMQITPEKIMPIDETAIIEITDDKFSAYGRFFPAMEGGKMLTHDSIVQELIKSGVKYGVDNDMIDNFLNNRVYLQRYLLASATMQVEGSEAEIKYFFNTDLTMKPKMNEDGSVDFHHLDMISPVTQGQLLAELKPADLGKPGIDVCGKLLKQVKVRNRILKVGKNIKLSEDGLRAYSEINGHASLGGDMIFVSNTYEVPANVDASTGDIDYEGDVVVKGNVNTGYTVTAKGDIIVEGVVEGAFLYAGGNIVLKRGISGMEKGIIKAGGNVISKFIESATIDAGGYVTADSIMHSNVTAKGDVTADGKKGFISGGIIRSGTLISARNIGSSMGATTVLECGIDPAIITEYHDLDDELVANAEEMEKLMVSLQALIKRIKLGEKLPPDKLLQLKHANERREQLNKRNEEIDFRMKDLKNLIDSYVGGAVRAQGVIHPGCKIIISNAVYYVKGETNYCRFYKENGDVKLDVYF